LKKGQKFFTHAQISIYGKQRLKQPPLPTIKSLLPINAYLSMSENFLSLFQIGVFQNVVNVLKVKMMKIKSQKCTTYSINQTGSLIKHKEASYMKLLH
jgi:hypothetical protein